MCLLTGFKASTDVDVADGRRIKLVYQEVAFHGLLSAFLHYDYRVVGIVLDMHCLPSTSNPACCAKTKKLLVYLKRV